MVVFVILKGVWDLKAGVKQFKVTGVGCREDYYWEAQLSSLSESIISL